MKLMCNVCREKPIVNILETPKNELDTVVCPCCGKLLAYATEKKYSQKLIFSPVDYIYSETLGRVPVLYLDKSIEFINFLK